MLKFLMKTIAVLRKETIDSLRDRRSLAAALLYSLLGPLVVGMALSSLARSAVEQPLHLTVAGGERAPSLVAYLEERGAMVETLDDVFVPSAVRDGSEDLVLSVGEDYVEDFRSFQPASVRLVYDSSRDESRKAADRTRRFLAAYNRQVGETRILARGLSPALLGALDIGDVDMATMSSRAARILMMVPIYLLAAAFIGGMNVSIDTTAGERERGSLEALLIHPVSRQALAFGKYLAAVGLNLVAVALTLVVLMKVLRSEKFQALDVPLGLGLAEATAILGLLLPLAFFGPALQMLISLFAKSYKEAQTYLSLLIFVPMLPGMLLAFDSLAAEAWMERIPILGQQMLITEVLRGEPIAGLTWASLCAVTLAVAFGAVYTTGRLLEHERIVLGR